MTSRKAIVLFAGVLMFGASPAAAQVIFSDNFNANSPGNLGTVPPLTWTLAPGTGSVDTLNDFGVTGGGACSTGGSGSPSAGVCIDLDGSTSAAGRLQHDVTIVTPGSYQLTFWVRGNGRGAAADTVDFGITGLVTDTLTMASADPWVQVTRTVVVATPGTYVLFFDDRGADNIGVWLDDVTVQATPGVPTMNQWLLIALAGMLGGVAWNQIRRRAVVR